MIRMAVLLCQTTVPSYVSDATEYYYTIDTSDAKNCLKKMFSQIAEDYYHGTDHLEKFPSLLDFLNLIKVYDSFHHSTHEVSRYLTQEEVVQIAIEEWKFRMNKWKTAKGKLTS